jgi:hypothetical protein
MVQTSAASKTWSKRHFIDLSSYFCKRQKMSMTIFVCKDYHIWDNDSHRVINKWHKRPSEGFNVAKYKVEMRHMLKTKLETVEGKIHQQ